MSDWCAGWLIGAAGLFWHDGERGWDRRGGYSFRVTAIIRAADRVLVSTGNGLWQAPRTGDVWTQLHDETLTEVLAIAALPGDPGVVAASAYGVATGARDELGAVRWTSCSDPLRVNERFSNAILVDPTEASRWLVGTEAGVLVAAESGRQWQRSNLLDRPVRALCHHDERFWAGADDGGVWASSDGLTWERAGRGLDDDTVFALSVSDGRLLAGTERGVASGDGRGAWRMSAPQMRVSAIAAHPEDSAYWMAGAYPGGLWFTDDAGETWQQHAGFGVVEAIVAPQ